MNRKLILLFPLFICQVSMAQTHRVVASLTNNTSDQHCMIDAISDIYESDIDNDYIKLKRLDSGEEGWTKFTVTDFNSTDEIKISLENESTPSEKYTFEFNNGEVYVGINGMSFSLGAYANNDSFIIQRCDDQIVFTWNNTVVSSHGLADSNFPIINHIESIVADDSDFELIFESLDSCTAPSTGDGITLEGNVGKVINTWVSETICCSTFPEVYPMDSVMIIYDNPLTGYNLVTISDDPTGDFQIIDAQIGTARLRPNKVCSSVECWGNGVTAFDKMVLEWHISQSIIIKCPFYRVAGDVNNDGFLTQNDADLIEDFVLGNISFFPDVPPWRFFSTVYTLPGTYSYDMDFARDFWDIRFQNDVGDHFPFMAEYHYQNSIYDYNGDTLWIDALNEWGLNSMNNTNDTLWSFHAVKTGDVDGSADPTFSAQRPVNTSFSFEGNKTTLEANKQYRLLFKFSIPQQLLCFQVGIHNDSSQLIITNMDTPYPDDLKYNFQIPNTKIKGARVMWITNNSRNGTNSTAIPYWFAITVETKNSAINNLGDVLSISQDVMPIEFIAAGIEKIDPSEIDFIIEIEELP